MNSHEIDYRIHGDDLQTVEIELDPQETVIAEAGAMNWMEEDIAFEARMGDGSEPNSGFMGKLFGAGKRMLTGESLFMTHFTNRGALKRHVAFAAPYPGKIVPVDLAALGGDLLCQKDAFLCAAMGTRVSIAFNKKLGAGFFGGEGFILQKLQGDGNAFLHAGGTVVKKELRGETLRVDTGCIVAFDGTVDYEHRDGGQPQEHVLRRRGAVPGDPARTRHGVAAEPAVQPPGRSDSDVRPAVAGVQRGGKRPRWTGPDDGRHLRAQSGLGPVDKGGLSADESPFLFHVRRICSDELMYFVDKWVYL